MLELQPVHRFGDTVALEKLEVFEETYGQRLDETNKGSDTSSGCPHVPHPSRLAVVLGVAATTGREATGSRSSMAICS